MGPKEHKATVLSNGKHCYQGLKSGWDFFNDYYKLSKPHWPIGKKIQVITMGFPFRTVEL